MSRLFTRLGRGDVPIVSELIRRISIRTGAFEGCGWERLVRNAGAAESDAAVALSESLAELIELYRSPGSDESRAMVVEAERKVEATFGELGPDAQQQQRSLLKRLLVGPGLRLYSPFVLRLLTGPSESWNVDEVLGIDELDTVREIVRRTGRSDDFLSHDQQDPMIEAFAHVREASVRAGLRAFPRRTAMRLTMVHGGLNGSADGLIDELAVLYRKLAQATCSRDPPEHRVADDDVRHFEGALRKLLQHAPAEHEEQAKSHADPLYQRFRTPGLRALSHYALRCR